MVLPMRLEIANTPACVGQSDICAVGIGTRQPAKLYFSAPCQLRDVGRGYHIGEQLRAACRYVPPKEDSVDALLGLADFSPPPGLSHPRGLVMEADCEKATTAGRGSSPSPPCSDTATPESTSDLDGASSQGSDTSDECEDVAEHVHVLRQVHGKTQQGPPGFFCAASCGPMRSPPGIFF